MRSSEAPIWIPAGLDAGAGQGSRTDRPQQHADSNMKDKDRGETETTELRRIIRRGSSDVVTMERARDIANCRRREVTLVLKTFHTLKTQLDISSTGATNSTSTAIYNLHTQSDTMAGTGAGGFSTIAIIGAGSVGCTIAHTLMLRRVCAEVRLVDIAEDLCRAQVQDLQDATYLTNVRIKYATPQEAGQSDIIVITAGAKQKPGETRLDLIEKNYKVLGSVLKGLQPINPQSIILLVANPVDVLTHFAQQMSGLPKNQVLGSGTLLDSIRLRGLLAQRLEVCIPEIEDSIKGRPVNIVLQISDNSINAYVIGEHGDSQCVAWSSVTVSGAHISVIDEISDEDRTKIGKLVSGKANAIIRAKGFTSYGIGATAANICEAILFDQRPVYPLSCWHEEYQCCISLPAVVGRKGIVSQIPLPLNDKEKAQIEASAKTLREQIAKF
ncbi:hypothetical protein Dda_5658 [Drechslerella dactyloides]|uniref:L-lactate dehydrogenase n=1 Tax=Drechslerella dactyloides TaxID=74499 RepID=A0AAD6IWH9_DREDA|nr:hypothetical protein Dda_5658 [Drechslerella dactyloides]